MESGAFRNHGFPGARISIPLWFSGAIACADWPGNLTSFRREDVEMPL